jgi:hypothetical protein
MTEPNIIEMITREYADLRAERPNANGIAKTAFSEHELLSQHLSDYSLFSRRAVTGDGW